VFVTVLVVILNVATDSPAATVTVCGTVALWVLMDKAIDAPPVGAGPLRVTVPVADVPPNTVGGATATLTRVAGVIVSGADF
jgi:hypothetical protein